MQFILHLFIQTQRRKRTEFVLHIKKSNGKIIVDNNPFDNDFCLLTIYVLVLPMSIYNIYSILKNVVSLMNYCK